MDVIEALCLNVGDLKEEIAEINHWRREVETVLRDLCEAANCLLKDIRNVRASVMSIEDQGLSDDRL